MRSVPHTRWSPYIDQDREIKQINTHISQLQQENAQLKAEQTWWNDDNYVRQQARSRLYYVNPGDTPYVVTGHYRGLHEGGRYFCEREERPRGSLDHEGLEFSREELAPATGRNPAWQAPGTSGRG